MCVRRLGIHRLSTQRGHAHFETPLLYFKIAELSLSDWGQMVLYGLTPHTEENIRIVLEGLRGEDSIAE